MVEYNQRMHFFYAQDDWRIAHKLTLNIGIRYELATPPYETNNQLSNFDPATSPTGGLVVASGGSIFNRALINRNNLNFAPRFGLAYSLDLQDGCARGLRHQLSAVPSRRGGQ